MHRTASRVLAVAGRAAVARRRRRGPRPRTSRPRRLSSTARTSCSTATAARTRPGPGADGTGVRTHRADGASRCASRGRPTFGPERSAPNFVTPPAAVRHRIACSGSISARRARGRRVAAGSAQPARTGASAARTRISTYAVGARVRLARRARRTRSRHGSQRGRRGRQIVRAAIRRRGPRFGRPVTLRARGRARACRGRAPGPGVDVRRMGARRRRGGARAARGPADGVRYGGSAGRAKGSTRSGPRSADRRAYLVWLAESGDESAVLRVAVLPAGRHALPRAADGRHGRARLRPPSRTRPRSSPISERDALLAWTDWDGPAWRVRAAVTGPGARFGAPFDVSPPGEQAVLGDADAIPAGTQCPAGTVMVVWSRLDAVGEVGDRVRAALRPPGGAFGRARGRQRPRPRARAGRRVRLASAAAGRGLVAAHRPRPGRPAEPDHDLPALLHAAGLMCVG